MCGAQADETALMAAARRGHVDTVSALLSAGASMDAKDDV